MKTMKKTTLYLVTLAMFLVMAAACSPAPSPEATPDPQRLEQEADYQTLLEQLRAQGADVELVQEVNQPLIPAITRVVNINGQNVQVMVFTDEQTRITAQDNIDLGAGIIPETGTTGNEQMYYWASGRIVAMYFGEDEQVVAPLTEQLGQPVIVFQQPPGSPQLTPEG
jgi:hypothetical protein